MTTREEDLIDQMLTTSSHITIVLLHRKSA